MPARCLEMMGEDARRTVSPLQRQPEVGKLCDRSRYGSTVGQAIRGAHPLDEGGLGVS